MSMKDGLTGIANRRAFDEHLALEWRRSQRNRTPISLLMIDIDHFKQFNDTYGHLEGDRCIRAVAKALQEEASRAGDLLARYGGEEFALLLPDTDVDASDSLAQACLATIEALAIPHASSGSSPWISLSIGCATLWPGDGQGPGSLFVSEGVELTPDRLIEQADAALYQAKRSGRRRRCRLSPGSPHIGE